MRLLNRFSWLTAIMFGGSVTGLVGACVLINENHCAKSLVACSGNLVCDRCAVANDGCVAVGELTNESCLVSSSDTASVTDPTTTTETTTTIGTTDATTDTTIEPTSQTTVTEPTTTTITDPSATETGAETDTSTSTGGFMCDPEMPADNACLQKDPGAPYCVGTDVCGPCSELVGTDCEEVTGGALPACHTQSGMCVECTEDNMTGCAGTNVCNLYLNDCLPCIEHEQCPSGACDLDGGECFKQDDVFWVESRFNCIGQNGSEEKPFCDFETALGEQFTRRALMIKEGSEPLEGPLVLNGSRTLALIGAEEGAKISSANGTGARIIVSDDAHLYISKVDLVDSPKSDEFLICTDATVKLDQLTLSGNKKPFDTMNCDLLVNRTLMTENTDGSVIAGGKLTMTNSFVTDNETGGFGQFRISSEVLINHTTVVNNEGASTSGFYCINASPFEVRNSVFLSLGEDKPQPIVDCNLMDDGGIFIGDDTDLETLFQAPMNGVYRPSAGAEIKDLAVWAVGDPFVDYDGVPRPNVAGAKDFAGAARP